MAVEPVPQLLPMQFWCCTAHPFMQQPGPAHSQPSSAVGAAGLLQLM